MKSNKNIDKLVNRAMEIEAEAAIDAGMLGFMCRSMAQATMPHRETKDLHYTRVNGRFSLSMAALNPAIGLPYGVMPRLIMAWLSTEAVRTQKRELALGKSMSDFMTQLGLNPSWGRWGTVGTLKEQSKRLFSCAINCTYNGGGETELQNMLVADKSDLWWDVNPNQTGLFESTVLLSQGFFDEIVNHPVPLDVRALRALKGSAMALDIYVWLTYRNSYLRDKTSIPWKTLQAQFGSSYEDSAQGRRNFKKKFLQQLRVVKVLYPKARVEETGEALILRPSPPHIAFAAKKEIFENSN